MANFESLVRLSTLRQTGNRLSKPVLDGWLKRTRERMASATEECPDDKALVSAIERTLAQRATRTGFCPRQLAAIHAAKVGRV